MTKAIVQFHPEAFTGRLEIHPDTPLPIEPIEVSLLGGTARNYFIEFLPLGIKYKDGGMKGRGITTGTVNLSNEPFVTLIMVRDEGED